jgi:hypothetical protein
MEISIAKSSSVSASNAALLVALELSKTTWVVALSAPFSDQIRHYSITGGDAVALLELIGRDAHDSGAVNKGVGGVRPFPGRSGGTPACRGRS